MKKTLFSVLVTSILMAAACLFMPGCDDDDDNPAPAATNAPPATVSTKVSDLQKSWTLQSFGNSGGEAAVLTGTTLTAMFNSSGGLSGHAGCNTFSGAYTADDTGNLSVGSIGSTLMLCSADIMTQESDYMNALKASSSFEIEGGTLRISYGAGKRMIFN